MAHSSLISCTLSFLLVSFTRYPDDVPLDFKELPAYIEFPLAETVGDAGWLTGFMWSKYTLEHTRDDAWEMLQNHHQKSQFECNFSVIIVVAGFRFQIQRK